LDVPAICKILFKFLHRFTALRIRSYDNLGKRRHMSAPTELVVAVTRRLFVSILVLVAVTLSILVYASASDSELIVPAVIVTAGCIGGFVGLQRRLKDLTVPDLELIAKSWIYTSLSPLVGGVLALLLYVLFLSELLKGDLFPRFMVDNDVLPRNGFSSLFAQHAAGYKDYAKLMFWCFVAGFSERFVTDVIGRFEGTAIRKLSGA
jgi:phosphate/sulfate permease